MLDSLKKYYGRYCYCSLLLRNIIPLLKDIKREAAATRSLSSSLLFLINFVPQSNVNGALQAYAKAVEASSQREIKLLCLHEVAWCHLIRLSYEEAYRSLTQLRQQSRWSVSFYAYLATGTRKNICSTLRLSSHDFCFDNVFRCFPAQFAAERSVSSTWWPRPTGRSFTVTIE